MIKNGSDIVSIQLVWIEIPKFGSNIPHDILVPPLVAEYINELEKTDIGEIKKNHSLEVCSLKSENNLKENKLNDISVYIQKRIDFANESQKKLDSKMELAIEYYRGVIDTLESLSKLIQS